MRAITTLLLGAFLTFTFEGCSSDDSSGSHNTLPDAGGCDVKFCPSSGTATACCAGKVCGLNYGNGCIAMQPVKKDGG